jgi:hypothetical protein
MPSVYPPEFDGLYLLQRGAVDKVNKSDRAHRVDDYIAQSQGQFSQRASLTPVYGNAERIN